MTTIDDLVTKLQQQEAALGDGGDLRSDSQKAEFFARKVSLAGAISGLRNAPADLARAQTQLADYEARRPRVIAAQAEIEQLIEQQPDWRTVRPAQVRDRAWGVQQDLFASRKALNNGVEYFGGVPAVPNALKKILGVVIESDGREVPNWYGSLAEVDQRIRELTARRDRAQAALDSYLRVAESLLGEAVTT